MKNPIFSESDHELIDKDEDDDSSSLIGENTLEKLARLSKQPETTNVPVSKSRVYTPHDYSDKYYLKQDNPKPHTDVPLKILQRYSTKIADYAHSRETVPKEGVTTQELRALYNAFERDDIALVARLLAQVSADTYPLVVKECPYESPDGVRHFNAGGTPALKDAMTAFRQFTLAYESGEVGLHDVDGVIYACHNNGVLADKFLIDCDTEEQAIEFLDSLGGIKRKTLE